MCAKTTSWSALTGYGQRAPAFAAVPEGARNPRHPHALVEADGVGHGSQKHGDARPELATRFVEQPLPDAEALSRCAHRQLGQVAAPREVGDAACNPDQRPVRRTQPRGQDQIRGRKHFPQSGFIPYRAGRPQAGFEQHTSEFGHTQPGLSGIENAVAIGHRPPACVTGTEACRARQAVRVEVPPPTGRLC